MLVTYDGDGHTAYGGPSDCINDLVDAYLVDLTVPANGAFCPNAVPYAIAAPQPAAGGAEPSPTATRAGITPPNTGSAGTRDNAGLPWIGAGIASVVAGLALMSIGRRVPH